MFFQNLYKIFGNLLIIYKQFRFPKRLSFDRYARGEKFFSKTFYKCFPIMKIIFFIFTLLYSLQLLPPTPPFSPHLHSPHILYLLRPTTYGVEFKSFLFYLEPILFSFIIRHPHHHHRPPKRK